MGRSVSASRVEKLGKLLEAGRLCCMMGTTGLCCLNKGCVCITENVTDYDEKGNVVAKSGDIVLTYCKRHFRELRANLAVWEGLGMAEVDRENNIVVVTTDNVPDHEGKSHYQVQNYYFDTVEEF